MTTALQKKEAGPVERLKTVMAMPSVQEQFKNALAEHSNKFVASLIDLYASDSYLQGCAPNLVVMEALKAATLNLPINKQLGFAYVVPYSKSRKDDKTGKWVKELIPQFQIGYKGLIQLAMRSGVYRYINAGPVYEGEYKGFSKLTGELDISGTKKSNTTIGYFAYMETVNGFKKSMFMAREDMEAYAEKYSKSFSKDSSPWKTEFDAMAEKTMLRRLLSKYGQMTIEMAEGMAMDSDNEVELDYQENANKTFIDITPEPPPNVNTDTGEVIDAQPEEPEMTSAEADAALAAAEQGFNPGY